MKLICMSMRSYMKGVRYQEICNEKIVATVEMKVSRDR